MDKKYTRDQIKDAIWQELKESDYAGENNDRAYEIIGIVMAGIDKIVGEPQPGVASPWITADTKPEHNVGVLVFIPGEDSHITSGMWDIDNKWVLLDEYRTPDCEVTHWTRLPAFPDGYTHDVISDEWVSTLKAIAKDELSKKGTAAGWEEFIQRIRDFNLSDVDAPVFTHTKEFAAHFSYIKGKLMDMLKVEGIAGREEDAVAFAEWIRANHYNPYGNRWRRTGSNLERSSAQLYELFKQKEK